MCLSFFSVQHTWQVNKSVNHNYRMSVVLTAKDSVKKITTQSPVFYYQTIFVLIVCVCFIVALRSVNFY